MAYDGVLWALVNTSEGFQRLRHWERGFMPLLPVKPSFTSGVKEMIRFVAIDRFSFTDFCGHEHWIGSHRIRSGGTRLGC